MKTDLKKAYRLLQEKLLIERAKIKDENILTEVGQMYDDLDSNTRFLCELLFACQQNIENQNNQITLFKDALLDIKKGQESLFAIYNDFTSKGKNTLNAINDQYHIKAKEFIDLADNQSVKIKREFGFIKESIEEIKTLRSTAFVIIFPIVALLFCSIMCLSIYLKVIY